MTQRQMPHQIASTQSDLSYEANMKKWGWAPRYDEDPESVPLWFRGVRSIFWLIVVVTLARSIWAQL